jgi:hypothetical protein
MQFLAITARRRPAHVVGQTQSDMVKLLVIKEIDSLHSLMIFAKPPYPEDLG